MILLQRQREATPKAFSGRTRRNRELRLLQDRRNGTPFNSDYWKGKEHWKACKKQLRKESFDKCAYCESTSEVAAKCDVGHFRPKSIYWWLVYYYENYVYACQQCNRHHKLDHFPIHGQRLWEPTVVPTDPDETLKARAGRLAPDPLNAGEGMPKAEYLQACELEEPGLIHPYETDPEPSFRWLADENLRSVELKPRDDSLRAKRRFEAAEKYLGLNRDELTDTRWRYYCLLKRFHNTLQRMEGVIDTEPARQEALEGMRLMMRADYPYAGMARYFVQVEWGLDLEPEDPRLGSGGE